LPMVGDVHTMFIVMAHSRKGGRQKLVPTPVSGPLGRYFAMFRSRGNPVMKLEQAGPVVEARTPEELAAKTKAVMEREGEPDEVN